MSVKILIFDYRKEEKPFFDKNKFDYFDIEFFEESLDEQMVEKLSEDLKKDTTVISVFVKSFINEKVLKSFPNLRIIATRSTGCNHIDMLECENQNIRVLNVENYGATAVTQFIFGLILCSVRNIIPAIDDMRKMQGNFNSYTGRDLNQLTLGVLGTGAIGSGVCKIGHAFGMKILAFDILKRDKLTAEYDVQYVDRETIYKNADVISLNLPYNTDLYHMISTKELEMMKNTCHIINASRGELVDITALYEALKSNKIGGCALDVIECENLGFYSEDFMDTLKETSEKCVRMTLILQKLIELPNVIITPHIAYDTQDAIDYILETTMSSIKDNILGGHANRIN